MAVANVITRGYGPSASIAFILTRGYSFGAGVPTAAVGGVTAFTEPLLVDGGQATTITLSNDTWQASGTAFDQIRQIILNGITSAQSENTGWNKEVRDNEAIASVVRTSDTVVTITWTAAPDYDITVAETITVTIPDEAVVVSASDLVATPTIDVTATAPILEAHILKFASVSRSITFSATQQKTTFASVSRSIVMVDTPQPLGFILTEDGDDIIQENDLPVALE